MQINGMNPLFGIQRVNPTVQTQSVTAPANISESKSSNTIQDDIRLSSANTSAMDVNSVGMTHGVADTEGIRIDLVNRIRSEIAAGTYETEAKLDIALNRMLSEIQNS